MDRIKISSALISVFDKQNLNEVVNSLSKMKVKIYSTGGTESYIRSLGHQVTAVEDLTSYPSILGGRVKTLHPKIFGGILNRKEISSDINELKEYNIPQIDLVVVDLYPFKDTIIKSKDQDEIIEKIDIGGISLIRAAAKNFKNVFCISDKGDYNAFLKLFKKNDGYTFLEERKIFASKAFNISSDYDTSIFNYFNKSENVLKISANNSHNLRYGENPHQKGEFYGNIDKVIEKINGKEISYNNLLDIDAAINLMSEFNQDLPTFAILKHNNACGLSTQTNLSSAYKKSLSSDPLSAFGGVLISNSEIDFKTAKLIDPLFFEVIIAPKYDQSALSLLKKKKNRIILVQKRYKFNKKSLRSCLNGYLVQDKDNQTDNKESLKLVTKKSPTKKQIEDLLFASKISKHTKSNTIVLAKDKQLVSSGTGQTSRVDALKQAIEKANCFGFNLKGSVMASDAFFPFPDCVEIANSVGIVSVIQPGGSIKDNLSIEYCNKNNISMVFSGIRHFKH
ncbi:MAG: bifunctional phosphoribosylaminoimidazolecarboxamide formyltransferase/IMP cyclohydrolase PurH [Flavobacteriaceae bacterium]|nr:bifunctional phosphoribosylaminoimidazolecarboxamide formyltransferase/IMP cyclohydrolase PurH [Flavobacteriaceae bacterium]